MEKRKFKISKKFDTPSVYYGGMYYFLNDSKEGTTPKTGKKCMITQGIYYLGKWKQDTFYICDLEFYNEMKSFAESKGILNNESNVKPFKSLNQMKFSTEHYNSLKTSIANKLSEANMTITELYEKKKWQTTRQTRWDLFWLSGWSNENREAMDAYNDTHIDTALKNIVEELKQPTAVKTIDQVQELEAQEKQKPKINNLLSKIRTRFNGQIKMSGITEVYIQDNKVYINSADELTDGIREEIEQYVFTMFESEKADLYRALSKIIDSSTRGNLHGIHESKDNQEIVATDGCVLTAVSTEVKEDNFIPVLPRTDWSKFPDYKVVFPKRDRYTTPRVAKDVDLKKLLGELQMVRKHFKNQKNTVVEIKKENFDPNLLYKLLTVIDKIKTPEETTIELRMYRSRAKTNSVMVVKTKNTRSLVMPRLITGYSSTDEKYEVIQLIN